MEPPTPEAIAQAVALLEPTCQVWESHVQLFSPGGKAAHEAAAALRLLLTLAADYVPVEDRERAIELAKAWDEVGPAGYAEARRWLKLPAREEA